MTLDVYRRRQIKSHVNAIPNCLLFLFDTSNIVLALYSVYSLTGL